MNKTPEELAEKWANKEGDLWFADISTYTDGHKSAVKQGFLAGYKARDKEIAELKTNWTFCCEDKARLLQELAAKEDKS